MASSIIVFAALIAYHNSFSGPFVFDDQGAITDNPSIRYFGSALSPSPAESTAGRPLLNLTFALNYALGGMNVRGYHVLNLFIHTLAGLTLFGIVRRTLLERPTPNIQHPTSKSNHVLQQLSPTDATLLALAVAVIWTVHPLQTEAVTYISQRAESLMGLFYLLTLYCFLRSVEKRYQVSGTKDQEQEFKGYPSTNFRPLASALWLLASVFACLLGALSKEIIITAPVLVLLYDRTFVAGSFRAACRLRWRYYLGLAGTWLLLACLMTSLGQRNVGFGQGVTWWSYALTSCRSVVLYLKLAVWPHPLVFDYGTGVVQHVIEVVPYALILAGLIAATAIAMWRWPIIGFVGAWFFVILAPASSVIPVAGQPMAEHRLYLSLAAVVALGVLGLHRLLGRRGLMVGVAAAVGLGWLTVQRNNDYRSELAIWNDTAIKQPDNARAHYNLGMALEKIPGRLPDAISHFETALRIKPDYAEAHSNLGIALAKMPGRVLDAIAHFEAALRIKPGSAEVHNNLGVILATMPGRLPESISCFEAALRINPDYAEVHYNLGNALVRIPGRLPDAISHYEAALRLKPDYAEAHYKLGRALANSPGRLPDAVAHFEAALRMKPDSPEAHYDLGYVLMQNPSRIGEAIQHFETALELQPNYADAQNCLGICLARGGQIAEAIPHFDAAVRIEPNFAEAHLNLGRALVYVGRPNEAAEHFQMALKLDPNLEEARRQLERLER